MRALLVICDTRTTQLSLRPDPQVPLYRDPPTSTLQYYFDMFVWVDCILRQTPAHITAIFVTLSVRTPRLSATESPSIVPSASAKAIVPRRV